VSTTAIAQVSHGVTRLTVDTRSPLRDFQARYEAAVPPAPMDEVTALIERRASWDEMLALVAARAPHGFLIYARIPVDPLMRLAGDATPCVAYLMGNHTIAERMFRHDPEVMLHAPLRTVIWEGPGGTARFSIDQPSVLFGSFGSPEIAAVGVELDRKVAALLDHLGVEVPPQLLDS
jgi:uncharacterized protein (DUF302 family)